MFDVLPFGDVLDWHQLLENIPPTVFDQQDNIIDLLAATHNDTRAAAKLKALRSIRHVLQYSMQPDEQQLRLDRMHVLDNADDAYTFSWKAIVRQLCRQRALPAHRCMLGGAPPHGETTARTWHAEHAGEHGRGGQWMVQGAALWSRAVEAGTRGWHAMKHRRTG